MLHVTEVFIFYLFIFLEVFKKDENCACFFSSLWAIAFFFFFFPSRVILTYFCSNELMFLSQMTALKEKKINMLIQKKKKKRERWEELNMGNGRSLIKLIRSQMPVPDFNFK